MAFRMIGDWIPGLRVAGSYQRDWLGSDLRAGLSVAAVAVPTGIAYAQLAGLPPVVRLYASILPPVAYALFGSSRQLIVGPDSAQEFPRDSLSAVLIRARQSATPLAARPR